LGCVGFRVFRVSKKARKQKQQLKGTQEGGKMKLLVGSMNE
jgi:hypothetical protein